MKKQTEKKSFFGRVWRFCRNAVILFFVISIAWALLTRFVPVWATPLMYIRATENISEGKILHWEKKWISIDKISPNMIQAVVAAEDNLFLEHRGFSFDDINKAIKNSQNGKPLRGGSTISQQTAKNVFLWSHRSWLRKGFETYFTVLIETFWSKKRIMEVYLNVIETGDGVYGVEAAAQKFFGKSAAELTNTESARIAVCLPNPRRYKVDKPSSYIKKRTTKIKNLMGKIGKVDFENKQKAESRKNL